MAAAVRIVMYEHEEKYCGRCNSTIECSLGDIANCQRASVSISEGTQLFLEATSYDCLCSKCLVEINQLVQFSKLQDFPKQKALMIEGLHYYIDNGFFVFTELYHLQRGFCCENNCRHCAYGNKKITQ